MPSFRTDYNDLLEEIGTFIGYGPSPDGWTTDERRVVDRLIKRGLGLFYSPESVLPGFHHHWSFLMVDQSLELTEANDGIVDLPATFMSLNGEPVFVLGQENVMQQRITVLPEINFRKLVHSWERNGGAGRPKWCSVRTKPQSDPQIYQIRFWPKPDMTYEVVARINTFPLPLDADNLVPMGSAEHAETIREACLSVAEQMKDENASFHTLRFKELLMKSIDRDRLMPGVDHLGLVIDPSILDGQLRTPEDIRAIRGVAPILRE